MSVFGAVSADAALQNDPVNLQNPNSHLDEPEGFDRDLFHLWVVRWCWCYDAVGIAKNGNERNLQQQM